MSPESALAEWVFRQRDSLHAVMGQSGDISERLRANPALLDGCPTCEVEVIRLLSVAQFGQVLNDLRQMSDKLPGASPTLAFLQSALLTAQDNVVLDVGCSAGRHLWEVSSRLPGRLVGLDLDLLAMMAGAWVWRSAGHQSPEWVKGSVLSLPFAEGVFSHVISGVTLSLVPIRPALGELARVLRPGGQLVLTVEGPGFWWSLWDQARPWSVQRLQLLRWWLGNRLMQVGIDWQRNRVTRRLAGLTQFGPETLARLVRRAGFEIDRCEALTHHRQQPALIGLAGRRR